MLFRHVGLDCGVSVRALPVVCRYPVQSDPDFNRLRIVYDLGLPAYMLIWNTVEVIPVHLEVIGGVDGYFLGVDVSISVQTVNNRVWRLAIIDAQSSNETNIKIRYNTLFNQFSNNGKYISLGEGKISDSEDISYKMAVDDKRYEASFGFIDSSINGLVWYMIAEQYGSYRIAMFYENLDNAANGDDL